MLLSEDTIDNLSLEYLNYFTALALGYNPKIKLLNNIECCVMGTQQVVQFDAKYIIPILINEGLIVAMKYTANFIESQIISKDGKSAYFGYAGTEEQSLSKALIIKTYCDVDIAVDYDTTIH
jgi:hypothetical protein|tara:strand:- start:878 stop:1243 length:366 start_codon:yes stop_codon:yes gene_type:complete